MFTHQNALASLTDGQRLALDHSPELSAAFTAEIQQQIDAIKPVGVSWSGMTRTPYFNPTAAFEKVTREAKYARQRVEIERNDCRLMVILTAEAGLEVTTDLDTLCKDWGVGSDERDSIRRAVTEGRAYQGDYAGWTKFKLQHTIRAAASVQVAA